MNTEKSVCVTNIDSDTVDGITRQWYEIKGTVYGTGLSLDGIYGVTSDDRILDVDGCPITEGDAEYVAVRNAIGV